MRPLFAALLVLVVVSSFGCSIKKFAIGKLGDALAESGTTYASDEDPELVREAVPFGLKLIEGLLEQTPDHEGLLLAAASGFTQYAYAFVQQDADFAEDADLARAAELRTRARRLYLRARAYGLRGLEARHAGFDAALHGSAVDAVATATAKDVPFLYWTAAAWGGAISLGKDDPSLFADLPVVEAMLKRALALDEAYDRGAIHELMITLDGARADAMGGSVARAREHFRRAVELSSGERAGPYLALAEAVSVRNQDKAEFVSLLEKALAVDPDRRPEWRLANTVLQRRARFLLARVELLFAE
jgi:tetratricopeptide (TPR) repeat protein